MKAYVREVGVTMNRLFTDKLSYLRIPPMLLYSHLVLCPTYVRLFLMLSGNYSSNEKNFFLRILVERNFCFHMGISQGGVVGDFPFVSVSLRGFPICSLIFGYFPFVIGYSVIDLSSWRQTSPTHSAR